jgi:hypothetical protein
LQATAGNLRSLRERSEGWTAANAVSPTRATVQEAAGEAPAAFPFLRPVAASRARPAGKNARTMAPKRPWSAHAMPGGDHDLSGMLV